MDVESQARDTHIVYIEQFCIDKGVSLFAIVIFVHAVTLITEFFLSKNLTENLCDIQSPKGVSCCTHIMQKLNYLEV